VSKTIFSSNQMRKGDDLLGSVVILVNCNEKKNLFLDLVCAPHSTVAWIFIPRVPRFGSYCDFWLS
jgi:hypothetical protein